MVDQHLKWPQRWLEGLFIDDQSALVLQKPHMLCIREPFLIFGAYLKTDFWGAIERGVQEGLKEVCVPKSGDRHPGNGNPGVPCRLLQDSCPQQADRFQQPARHPNRPRPSHPPSHPRRHRVGAPATSGRPRLTPSVPYLPAGWVGGPLCPPPPSLSFALAQRWPTVLSIEGWMR